jgi:hypothetical protein
MKDYEIIKSERDRHYRDMLMLNGVAIGLAVVAISMGVISVAAYLVGA